MISPVSPPSPISRRRALGLSAGALLSLGLWPGWAAGKGSRAGAFRFIAINDTHYMSDDCGRFLDRVVHQMKYHRGIEFCLLVGDLVDKGVREHLANVRDIFAALRVPVYVVPGNHDHLTDRDRRGYDEIFAGRSNYWFEHRGWQFVALDSTQGAAYEKTKIQPATFQWLDDTMPKLERTRPTVVFTHFPLGDGVRYRPLNADALLDRLRPFNLRAVYNGHFHGFTEREFQHVPITTNRCCSLKRGNHDKTKEKGYFVCTAREDGTIERRFVEVMMRPRPEPGRRIA